MISIVIRSKNDAELIGATISAVHGQDVEDSVELIHIDSGSTDGTVDLIRAAQPQKLIEIKAEEYVPGLVLNRGMREASGEWVVFLNSDCQPVDRQWLRELLAKRNAGIGAIFGRQEPRPGCQAVYAHDYERCFGDARESSEWEHFFSMANSAVNRAAWEQQPFREDLQYSEDNEWSRRLLKHGWGVAYAENARVMHSHNYTLRQAFRRCYGEVFALAALTTVTPAGGYGFFRTMILGNAREAVRDLRYCWRTRRVAEWPHALAVRTWQRAGRLRGFREGRRRCRAGNEAVAR